MSIGIGFGYGFGFGRKASSAVPSGTYLVDDDDSFIDTGDGSILETENE